MKENYKFANIVIQINYEDRKSYLVNYIQKIFLKSSEKLDADVDPDCFIELQDNLALPDKAVRIPSETDFIFEYEDEKFFFSPKQSLVSICPTKNRVRIESKSNCNHLFVHSAIGWLLIKTAFEKNLTYLDAYALNYKNKTIFLNGNSRWGKIHLFNELISMGAQAISNKEFILTDSSIYPLPIKTDLVLNNCRFDYIHMKHLELFDNSKFYPPNEINFNKVIIFVDEWYEEKSRYKSLSIKEATDELKLFTSLQSNTSLQSFFLKEDFSKMRKNFEETLNHAAFYKFFIGSQSENSKLKLLELINNTSLSK